MQTSYSIVEARNNFAALVRNAEEQHKPVQVTRHGQSVAVILSMAEYERLTQQPPKANWLAAHLAWREKWRVDNWETESDPWADVRDKTPAREENPWL
ncbi:MAG: type II toxin-antitoxin system Phd/YefM family antitoxin [Candidatus Promineifilaceae bacterium]